jgi:hypothetical protein
MAWTFNGVGSQVRLGDDSALTIPNSDWSICGWFKQDSNAGNYYRRLLCWGTPGGTPHVQILAAGTTTNVINEDHLTARVIGTGGADTGVFYIPGKTLSSLTGSWVACTLTHQNSTNTTYIRLLDRANHVYYSGNSVIGLGAIDISEDLYLGATNGGADSARFVGDLAEWAFFPGTYMDNDDFHGFVHGGRSWRYPDCAWNVPMLREREEEWKAQLTVNTVNIDNNAADHPQLVPAMWSLVRDVQAVEVDEAAGGLDQTVTHTMNLTDTTAAVRDLPRSASHTINFVSLGGRVRSGNISATLSLTGIAAFFNLVADRAPVGNELNLTHEVQVAGFDTLEHDLGLTQTVNAQYPIRVSVTQLLGLTQHTSTPHRQFVEHDLGITDFLNTPLTPQSVSHTLNFVQNAPIGRVDQSLNLTHQVSFGFSQHIRHDLGLTDQLDRTGLWVRSVEHSNILGHALTWLEDTPCGRKQYTPFQGESTITSDVAAPSDDLQDPQGDTGNFALYTPYLGVATNRVVLRNPELDNRDRNAYNRVNHETRGGKLVVYSDPNWPKVRTMVVTIIGLTETQVDDMQDFMTDTLGQEIGLTDWEGRLWKGFITNPNEPAVQDGKASWTVTFQFEGEMLDVEQPGESDGGGSSLNLTHSVTAVIV